jgi:hypothetical protein
MSGAARRRRNVATGTLTDARPVAVGETWTSDHGALGFRGVTLTLP